MTTLFMRGLLNSGLDGACWEWAEKIQYRRPCIFQDRLLLESEFWASYQHHEIDFSTLKCRCPTIKNCLTLDGPHMSRYCLRTGSGTTVATRKLGWGSRVVEVLHGSTRGIGRRISFEERSCIFLSHVNFTVNKSCIGKHVAQLCLFLSTDGTTFLDPPDLCSYSNWRHRVCYVDFIFKKYLST